MYIYIHNNTSPTYIINIFIYLYLFIRIRKGIGNVKSKTCEQLTCFDQQLPRQDVAFSAVAVKNLQIERSRILSVDEIIARVGTKILHTQGRGNE